MAAPELTINAFLAPAFWDGQQIGTTDPAPFLRLPEGKSRTPAIEAAKAALQAVLGNDQSVSGRPTTGRLSTFDLEDHATGTVIAYRRFSLRVPRSIQGFSMDNFSDDAPADDHPNLRVGDVAVTQPVIMRGQGESAGTVFEDAVYYGAVAGSGKGAGLFSTHANAVRRTEDGLPTLRGVPLKAEPVPFTVDKVQRYALEQSPNFEILRKITAFTILGHAQPLNGHSRGRFGWLPGRSH